MGTAFVDEISDPALLRATEPYRERLQSTQKLETELEALASEREVVHADLESLSAARRPQRRLDELAGDFDTLETARAVVLAELAAAVRDSGAEVPAKCKPLFSAAEELVERTARVTEFLKRVEAGLELERLEHLDEQLVRDIEYAEHRMDEIKAQLAELKKSRNDNEKALAVNRELRGDLDDLLAADLVEKL
jgi:chromosome segregation ATPase